MRAIRQTQLQIRQIKASVQNNLHVTKHRLVQVRVIWYFYVVHKPYVTVIILLIYFFLSSALFRRLNVID